MSVEDINQTIDATIKIDERKKYIASKRYANIPKKLKLKPGWEIRNMSDGRTFYLDNNTRTTHWKYPFEDEETMSE